jgi:hypothetical protein
LTQGLEALDAGDAATIEAALSALEHLVDAMSRRDGSAR